MRYLIYKTTNILNGKYYIGAHIQKKQNDNYLGSGQILSKAIRKYGRTNFVREILFEFSNEDEMWEKEADLVTLDFVSQSNNYNIMLGGKGFKKGYCTLRNVSTGETKIFPKAIRKEMLQLGWEPMYSGGYNRYMFNGKMVRLATNDPRIKELGLVTWSSGKKTMRNADGEIVWINKGEETADMVSVVAGTVTVKDKFGNNVRLKKDDPRYVSGEFKGVNSGKIGLFDYINSSKETCCHCGKTCSLSNHKKWHGDNCLTNPKLTSKQIADLIVARSEMGRKGAEKNSLSYRITTPSGEIFVCNNYKKFCEENGISRRPISSSGITKHKGFLIERLPT